MLDIDRAKVEVPYQTRWWGADYTCDPRFVQQALGNGEVLIGLQPLNTRPHYYVMRVDSFWHLQGCRTCEEGCPDELVQHLDEILDAIEDEYGEKTSIEWNNAQEPESEPAPTGWPVFSGDSGESWFALDPTQYLRRYPR